MGESLNVEKFEIELDWNDPEEFLNHYNHLDIAENYHLIWKNNKLQIDDHYEIYFSQIEDFIKILVKNSKKGLIHLFVTGYNEYFGYEWENKKAWELKTRLEYYRAKEFKI